MDAPVSNSLRITFLVHMILAVIFGAALFLIPGRTSIFLGAQEQVQIRTSEGTVTVPGTTFVDPITSRILGAAYLAMGFSSFVGWRASRREQVNVLVQMELIFSILAIVAVLAVEYLSPPGILIPKVVWAIAAILAAFAVAWGLALRR